MVLVGAGGKIKEPLYTGDYTLTLIDDFWYMHLLTSGTLTIQSSAEYDLFCVGGGGKGGYGSSPDDDESYYCTTGGGGGGYTATLLANKLSANDSLSVVIGTGAASYGARGGTTSIGKLLSVEGGYSKSLSKTKNYNGANGGSGGGGGNGNRSDSGGAGGSDGSNGKSDFNYGSGGKGQNTTTRAFGEPANTLYAGGGGGNSADGGAGGGGNGSNYRQSTAAVKGTPNTGGGGGSGAYNGRTAGAAGGSGIAIIRWAA